jgi:hypothetical protein
MYRFRNLRGPEGNLIALAEQIRLKPSDLRSFETAILQAPPASYLLRVSLQVFKSGIRTVALSISACANANGTTRRSRRYNSV